MDRQFTGELIKRQYKRGQPYAQLVFKGARGTQLSLSRNVDTLRSLKVGERYQISGPEYTVGDKTFIREPEVLPAAPVKRTKRWVLSTVAAFLCILTGSVFAAKHFANHNTVNAVSGSLTQHSEVQGVSIVSSSQNTADTTPTATTPTTTTTSTTTTPHTTAKRVAASTTTPPPTNTTTSTSPPTTPAITTPTTPTTPDPTPPSTTDTSTTNTTPPPTDPTPPPPADGTDTPPPTDTPSDTPTQN